MQPNELDKENTKVDVLYGGWSTEREVSLATGQACAQALARAGFKMVDLVDVTPDIGKVLEDRKPQIAFNALHGKWGEDGHMQAILEMLRIPYTHSGVLASSLAMHKQKAKIIFRDARIPTAESKLVSIERLMDSDPMPMPYVVKPVAEGSSVGVHIVESEASSPVSVSLSGLGEYGQELMVERFVPGRELTCAVVGDVALGVLDIVSTGDFYNYQSKYAEGGSEHILPADIPNEVYRKIQQYALAAHMALGCKGVSRSDFRYDDNPGAEGEVVILEVNTQPGMTGTSLVPEIAQHAGHSFEELVEWMVKDASCDR
ncbi:MAG: D-alanine--D-alanine ligase [Alphaproteobacteria bacterium]|nr:D-alanine--D-alanine ligase [Alphaproteobacteria bacterium]